MTKGTQDGQNVERVVRKRYAINSGQDSIHGSTLFQTETQESQSFGFYASTGQGASEGGGPGTGKAVLYTPGMSMEVLGDGLKVRDVGDNSQLPAKIIKAKKGDMVFECENGNILLRAKNVFIDADGGGQDGQFVAKAARIAEIDSDGDIRFQCQKFTTHCTKDATVIVKGQYELKYGFMVAAAFADNNFGALTANLKKTQLSTMRTL